MITSRSPLKEVFCGCLQWRYRICPCDIANAYAALQLAGFNATIQAADAQVVWLSLAGNMTEPQVKLLQLYGELVSIP